MDALAISRRDRIEAALVAAFTPISLNVRDDSHKHAGHAGANPAGGSHMHVAIVSAAFAGMSRLARHRAVNDALAGFFDEGLHALSIEAEAPAK